MKWNLRNEGCLPKILPAPDRTPSIEIRRLCPGATLLLFRCAYNFYIVCNCFDPVRVSRNLGLRGEIREKKNVERSSADDSSGAFASVNINDEKNEGILAEFAFPLFTLSSCDKGRTERTESTPLELFPPLSRGFGCSDFGSKSSESEGDDAPQVGKRRTLASNPSGKPPGLSTPVRAQRMTCYSPIA